MERDKTKNTDLLHIMMKHSPIGMILVDKKGQIVTANHKVEELFGYNVEELEGNYIEILVPEPFKEKHVNYRSGYISNPTPKPMGGREKLLFGSHKQGHQIPLEISLIPIHEGGQEFVLGCLLDRHDYIQKQELSKSNKDLEEFAYIASHDLQAPLRHISSYVQFLMDYFSPITDPEPKKWAEYVLNGVEHMQSLINDLLKLSRVSKSEPEICETDLNEVASSVIDYLEEKIENAGAQVQCAKLPTLNVNPYLIKEVFLNVLDNSIKYRDKNRKLEIKVFATEEPHGWNLLFQDNGIGIQPHYFERIFNPFQRLKHDSSVEGNGIGLSVVKKIVSMHGGTVWVDSVPNEGATFHVFLPLF